MKPVAVKSVTFANDAPLALIAGPCQLESLEHARMLAEKIAAAAEAARTPWVFKGSFDKANRSSLSGKRGIGMEAGLSILSQIGAEFGVPVLTDIHTAEQCSAVAQAVDILQIPAFLSRQTDLLLAAGETGAAINVKKGQFLAPWDMANVADKIASTGNERLLLCERGSSFGYNNLVVDMLGFGEMKDTGFPLLFDVTHSLQRPGGRADSADGRRAQVLDLARAGVAVGIAGLFLEAHPDPDSAKCDGPCALPLDRLEPFLAQIKTLDDVVKQLPSIEIR